MTRKHPATADDLSMWDNPQESPLVRQLLRAGRDDQVEYDVDAGLARHLANLQSGTQSPPWAIAQSTVQKGWSPALLAWLLPPVISATAVGAWLYLRPAEMSPTPVVVSASTAPVSAPAAVIAAAVPSARPAVPARSDSAQPSITVVSPAVDAVNHDLDVQADAQQKARAANPIRVGRHVAVAHRARAAHGERDAERSLVAGGSSGFNPGSETASDTASRSTSSGNTTAATSVAATSVAATSVDPPAESRSETALAPMAQREPTAPTANERREAEPQAPRDTGVSDARLEREMQMLAVAQRVLNTDPERSLRLTRQGEQEFRGSMFSAERTQVSLLALVQLGRVDEARRLGAPFLRAYPNAPWSARLRQALASGRLPSSR